GAWGWWAGGGEGGGGGGGTGPGRGPAGRGGDPDPRCGSHSRRATMIRAGPLGKPRAPPGRACSPWTAPVQNRRERTEPGKTVPEAPITNTESARALYARTRTERFALGAFNVDNVETLTAIARAAAARRSPVLVEASHGEVEMLGLRNLRALVDHAREDHGIEIYLNLDHSPSVGAAKAAIDAGFEFIHIDLSQARPDATDEEIIEATREVV